jgi:hypothetical protein
MAKHRRLCSDEITSIIDHRFTKGGSLLRPYDGQNQNQNQIYSLEQYT